MLAKIISLLKPEVTVDAKLTAVSLTVGKELDDIESRLLTQEIRAFQRGEKGERGDKGSSGDRGKDGKDGRNGKDGRDGIDGRDGRDGIDGISVVDSWIAADSHLVLRLSNGKEIDAGLIEGDGKSSQVISTQLANEQITVSATAPTNPFIGQLWYDIS